MLMTLWRLLPLWGWIVALFAIAALGLSIWQLGWAVVLAALRKVPWWAWVAAGLTLAAWMWLRHHDAELIAKTRAEDEALAAKERTARVALISGLALDLGHTQQALFDERSKHTNDLDAQKADYEKQLHDYVPSGTSCLHAGFVRYTDAAAAGVPLPAGPEPGLASAPSGVGDDIEAGIIARNYAKYHACEARVSDILKEYDALRGQFNAKVAQINAQVK